MFGDIISDTQGETSRSLAEHVECVAGTIGLAPWLVVAMRHFSGTTVFP